MAHQNRVATVQTALNNNGAQLNVDGHMGPKTAAALKAFQKQHKLKVTGKAGRRDVESVGCVAASRMSRCAGHQRSVAPVAFATAATTFSLAASISASVSVRSRGWNTTSIASDFLPDGRRSP